MRKLLKEHYKHLLKEEFDYSSKTATIYHLTGHKTAQYDRNWATIRDKSKADYEQEVEDKYNNNSRTTSILKNLEKSAVAKSADQYKGSKGQAYYIAQQISSSLFDLGSYFQAGHGAMYGSGLYACYKLNPSIARTYGNVILRFEADISNFLIFNAEIAKGVYGEKFKLQDQFLQILKNKGFNYIGYLNQEIDSEISADADGSLNDFMEYLINVSETPNFLNSNYSNEESRTAGFALEALQKFSILFGGGAKIKLRDIIDGIIFSGNHDGPVCIVYHPETMKTYKLTGAGYFDGKGNPVIETDLAALGGKKSYSLKDSFANASEIDAAKAAEIAEERANGWKNVLVNYNHDEDDIILNISGKINNIINPLYNVIVESGSEEIMESRFNNTPELKEYIESLKKLHDFLQIGPSILAEPFIDFVESFGPGIEIVTKNEFESYCYLLKQYHAQSKMHGGYPPKLADFASNNLKCQAANEEEFNRLVEQHLDIIINKFDTVIKENIAKDIENVGYLISGDELAPLNNKYISCREINVEYNTSPEGQIVRSILNNVRPLVESVERSLSELFSHPALQTDVQQENLNNMLKNHWVDPNGKLDLDQITEYFGHYSVDSIMNGDLFYTVLKVYSGGRDASTGQLSSYKIDSEKCSALFIVKNMYGIKDSYGFEEVSNIGNMFKEGSKAMSIGTFLDYEVIKKELFQSKLDNLKNEIEGLFFIFTSPEIDI